MSFVSAHVLDASAGAPAAGVLITLTAADGAELGRATTDGDGRVGDLGPDRLEPGTYRVWFGVGDYFGGRGVPTLFPEVAVAIAVAAGEKHYHVPLLLSPFAYTTYRGS